MGRSRTIVLLCVSMLATPLIAAAQEHESARPVAQRGAHAISFRLARGPEVGYWHRISEHIDLGLQVGLVFNQLGDDERDLQVVIARVEPALKGYFLKQRHLHPYIYAGISGHIQNARIRRSGTLVEDRTNSIIAGKVGFGGDWFPMSNVSIGGHVGIHAGYQTQGDRGGFLANTFSSGIRLQLYF